MKKLFLVAAVLLLTACSLTPEATGELAQAAAVTSGMVIQAESVEEVLTQDINIPLHYMLLFGAACTFVPNPFQLVGRAFKMVFGGILEVWKLFRGK